MDQIKTSDSGKPGYWKKVYGSHEQLLLAQGETNNILAKYKSISIVPVKATFPKKLIYSKEIFVFKLS